MSSKKTKKFKIIFICKSFIRTKELCFNTSFTAKHLFNISNTLNYIGKERNILCVTIVVIFYRHFLLVNDVRKHLFKKVDSKIINFFLLNLLTHLILLAIAKIKILLSLILSLLYTYFVWENPGIEACKIFEVCSKKDEKLGFD